MRRWNVELETGDVKGGVALHLGGEIEAVGNRRDDLEDGEGTEPAVTQLLGGLLLEGQLLCRKHDRITNLEGDRTAVLVGIGSLQSLSRGGLLLHEDMDVLEAGSIVVGRRGGGQVQRGGR